MIDPTVLMVCKHDGSDTIGSIMAESNRVMLVIKCKESRQFSNGPEGERLICPPDCIRALRDGGFVNVEVVGHCGRPGSGYFPIYKITSTEEGYEYVSQLRMLESL